MEKGMKTDNSRTAFLVYLCTVMGTAIWIGMIFLAPYLRSQSISTNIFIYTAFSPVCHQIPGRSFHFFGFPLAVCGRCLGIYIGFFAGLILYPFFSRFAPLSLPRKAVFLAFSTPIALDTLGNFLRLWVTSNWLRFAIGLTWGAILPFYFVPGIAEFIIEIKAKRRAASQKILSSSCSIKKNGKRPIP